MTVQQWRKLDPICKRASRLFGPDRTAYVERRCGGNEELRQEVESQLEYHDRSSAFLGMLSSGGFQRVAHYKVLERIGEGGMGHVFKALDTRLNRLVALKALPPWAASSTRARELLLKEARVACSLNHPNIVTIYEVLKQKNADYIVMEYHPGQTLRDLIPAKGFAVQEALRYALEIADALTHAHAAGIIHRDLKPSNIFITDQHRIKLLDFGLAIPITAISGKQDKKRAQSWGTSVYMAPEQLRRGAPDPRSDQFAFGIILWEMLTGNHPFGPGSSKKIEEAILAKRFANRPRKVGAALCAIASRCLEKDPQSRFQFIYEVQAELLSVASSAEKPGALISQIVPQVLPRSQSNEWREARSAIALMNSENITKCREGASNLQLLLEQNDTKDLHNLVRRSMRDLILSVPRFKRSSISPNVRAIRRLAFDVHRCSSKGELQYCFLKTDFEYQDLLEMDFSPESLVGFRFTQSFLVGSILHSCDLTDCSFEGSRIRNVDFTGAILANVDFTGADWFNARNITLGQLEQVRHESLMNCPSAVNGFRAVLDGMYGLPFTSWSLSTQQELIATWNEYLKPGGLRDFVQTLHRSLP